VGWIEYSLLVNVNAVEDSKTDLVPETHILTTLTTPIMQLPPKRMNPKHIYKTKDRTYRVQMRTGSKVQINKKFSSNTQNEFNALWLCEYALIYISSPRDFEDIIKGSNFRCLVGQMVSSVMEFGYKLHEQLGKFESRDLIRRNKYEFIADTLQRIVPYVSLFF
jgi:hypothetical protein